MAFRSMNGRRLDMQEALLFAVSHTDAGCELTVFENGKACTVMLSPGLVMALIALLKPQ